MLCVSEVTSIGLWGSHIIVSSIQYCKPRRMGLTNLSSLLIKILCPGIANGCQTLDLTNQTGSSVSNDPEGIILSQHKWNTLCTVLVFVFVYKECANIYIFMFRSVHGASDATKDVINWCLMRWSKPEKFCWIIGFAHRLFYDQIT